MPSLLPLARREVPRACAVQLRGQGGEGESEEILIFFRVRSASSRREAVSRGLGGRRRWRECRGSRMSRESGAAAAASRGGRRRPRTSKAGAPKVREEGSRRGEEREGNRELAMEKPSVLRAPFIRPRAGLRNQPSAQQPNGYAQRTQCGDARRPAPGAGACRG